MKERQEFGFTLIELLVTLSVAAILMLIAIPSFQSVMQEVKLASTKSNFMTALYFARSEASKGLPGTIGTTTQVTICKSDTTSNKPVCDDKTCTGAAGEPGSDCWEEGWLVFRDANANGTLNDGTDPDYCAPSRDCTLKVFPPLGNSITLRTGTRSDSWIGYQPDGTPVGQGGTVASDTFRLCYQSDNNNAWSIIINTTGRARVQKGASSCP